MRLSSEGHPDFFSAYDQAHLSACFMVENDLQTACMLLSLFCRLHHFRLPSKSEINTEMRSRIGFPDWLMHECDAFTGSEDQSLIRYFSDRSASVHRTPSALISFMQHLQQLRTQEGISATVDYIVESPSEQRWVLLKILRGEKKSLFEVLPVFCKGRGLPIGRTAELLLRRHGQDFFGLEIINELRELSSSAFDIFPGAWRSAPLTRSLMQACEGESLPWPYDRALLLSTGSRLWWQDRRGRVHQEAPNLHFSNTTARQLLFEILLMNEHMQILSLSEYRKLSIRAKRKLKMICTDFFDDFPESTHPSWLNRMAAFRLQRAAGQIPPEIADYEDLPRTALRHEAIWVKVPGALFNDFIFRREEWEEATLHLIYVKLNPHGRRGFVFGEERGGKWKGLLTNPEGYEALEDELMRYVKANLIKKAGPVQIVRPGYTIRVVFSATTGKGRLLHSE